MIGQGSVGESVLGRSLHSNPLIDSEKEAIAERARYLLMKKRKESLQKKMLERAQAGGAGPDWQLKYAKHLELGPTFEGEHEA